MEPRIPQRKADTLMVRCSDHRLALACEQFLEKSLGVQRGAYDLIVVPGGPQFLCALDYLPKFLWVGRRWMRFLAEHHEVRQVVLISHQDCGWYRHVHGEVQDARQKDDLRRARAALTEWLPHLSVLCFFARFRDPDVDFEKVE
jgi:hypothetical protein